MIIIKQATIEDVSALQKLDQEVFVDNQQYDDDLIMDWAITEPGKKYFTELLNKPESTAFIAFDVDVPVGYITVADKSSGYRKSKYVEIENMGVNPTYRSHGIGSQLMRKALKWCKEKGFERAGVNSYSQNTRAIAFYKKNGFAEIDITLEQKLK